MSSSSASSSSASPIILYTYTYADVFCIRVTNDPYVRDTHFYHDIKRREYTQAEWTALGFTEKDLVEFLRIHREFRMTAEKLKLTSPAKPSAEFAAACQRRKTYMAHWGHIHETARKALVEMRGKFKKRLEAATTGA